MDNSSLFSQPCFAHLVTSSEEMRSEGFHFSRSAEKALAEGKPLTSIDYGMPPKFFQKRSFYRRFAAFSTLGALATGAFSVYHFKALKAGGRISPQLLQAVAGAAIGLTAAALSSLTYSKFKHFWNDLDYREERASEQKWIEKIREGEFDNLPKADREQINENHRDLMVFNSPKYKGENSPLVKKLRSFLSGDKSIEREMNYFIKFIDKAISELREIGDEKERNEIEVIEKVRLILQGEQSVTLEGLKETFNDLGFLKKESKNLFIFLFNFCGNSESEIKDDLLETIKDSFIELFDDELELCPDKEGAFGAKLPNKVIEELNSMGISQKDIDGYISDYIDDLLKDGLLEPFDESIEVTLNKSKELSFILPDQIIEGLKKLGYSKEKIQTQINNYVNFWKSYFLLTKYEKKLELDEIDLTFYYIAKELLKDEILKEIKESDRGKISTEVLIIKNKNEEKEINSFCFASMFINSSIPLSQKINITKKCKELGFFNDLKKELARNLINENPNFIKKIKSNLFVANIFDSLYLSDYQGSGSIHQERASINNVSEGEIRALLRSYFE